MLAAPHGSAGSVQMIGPTLVVSTRVPGPYQACHPLSSKSQLKKFRGKEQSPRVCSVFLFSAQGPWHQILKT